MSPLDDLSPRLFCNIVYARLAAWADRVDLAASSAGVPERDHPRCRERLDEQLDEPPGGWHARLADLIAEREQLEDDEDGEG